MPVSEIRLLPVPGLPSVMALPMALVLIITLLASTQAAPTRSSLLQDHTLPLTGLHRPGEGIIDVRPPDEEVEQLLALKNHRTNQRLYNPSLHRENESLQGRGFKTARSAPIKSTYTTESPLSYFLKDIKQGRPFHQQSSRVPSYTASDLAEYIYKTGDEDGVSMALQELTQEGMMSPEEALIYLHDVRKNLQNLILEEEQERHRYQEEVMKDLTNKSELSIGLPMMNGSFKQTNSEIDAGDQLNYSREALKDYSDDDYSFEEVIYQLAKLLFAQTQQRDGSDGSEKMMDLVIDILDQETQEGKITPEAHDKALDVMMNSLVEVVKENELASRSNMTYTGSDSAYIESYPAYSKSKPIAPTKGNLYKTLFKRKQKPKKKKTKPFKSGSDMAFSGSNPVNSESRLMTSGAKPAFIGSIPAFSGPNTAIGGSISAFSRINPTYSSSMHAYSGMNPADDGTQFADSSAQRKLVSFYYPKVQSNDNATSQKDINENREISD